MKVRSRKLYEYLLAAGVLDGTPEAIATAKLEYRKQYLKQYKKNKRPRKEVRLDLTLKQFQQVQTKALELEIRCTTYARQVILASVDTNYRIIPNRILLEKISQLLQIASIGMARQTLPFKQVATLIEEADKILESYLSMEGLIA